MSGLAGRPVRLVRRDEQGAVRSWVPQLFVRYSDGTGLLADCPAVADAGGERARLSAVHVSAACAEVGWAYRRLEPVGRALAGNVRWLAGYRHPRNSGGPARMALVENSFRAPRPLIEGVRAMGDPLVMWPAVFHALWSGRLSVPLSRPLHERVVASLGSRDCVADGVER
ncbi:TnsA-like heteromeric transposase endonuclease subunit [Streptomyces sp. NPDC059443]|uniref:TnsA-like heteromeric transposase endonuclease subunit n=1 Tax=unclassified Streptomyces TaxID=2593676 RepID=UPI0036C72923